MKIHSIRISNFRGFEYLTASFHDQLTVVVGNNGAGKSSLLDAVSVALGTFFMNLMAFPEKQSPRMMRG